MKVESSERLAAVKPYIFAKIAQKRKLVAARGVDIVDLGRGGPDQPPYGDALEELAVRAADPALYSYTPYTGSPELGQAIEDWYQRRFKAKVSAADVALLPGSKGGLSRLFLALCNPGDLVLLPDPAFPAYVAAATISQLQIHTVPLTAERGWLPDFKAIRKDALRRAKLILLNYPNNPTGAMAPAKFLTELLDWAEKTETLVVWDNAYSFLTYGDYEPLSILSDPRGAELAIEFHTFSKAYAMAGARIAFAAGNSEAIALLRRIELYYQAGIFAPTLAAATVALNEGDEAVAMGLAEYTARRELFSAKLTELGWEHELPGGATYFWLKLPGGRDDLSFCDELLEKHGVVLTPGSAFGEQGVGYVRASITVSQEKITEAFRRIGEFLA